MPELIPAAPGSPDWLAARRTGVTATDIVTILGLSSWDSQYSLYWRKLGQVPEVPDSDRFRLGRELEPYVKDRWVEEHGGSVLRGALWHSSDRPWQMATLDYDTESGPLEVKTWADADRHTWADAPPAAVRAQVLWQMDVMDVSVGHVGVVFLPSGEFRSYTLAHPLAAEHDTATGIEWAISGDSSLLCSICYDIMLMRQAGAEFMARLRLELPAPDPDTSAASLAAVRARFAKIPDKQAEIDSEVFKCWEQARALSADYSESARAFEIQLREQAGEASVLTVDGQPVARRITGDAHVKAHTRHNDYLRRIKQDGDE